jgi:hypothetical protein
MCENEYGDERLDVLWHLEGYPPIKLQHSLIRSHAGDHGRRRRPTVSSRKSLNLVWQ